jgi:hypothetical protein
MEDHPNILPTKLEQSMEQVIVMLNALMISNLFKEKLIAKIGGMIKVNMEAAVLSLMYGRQINKLMLLLLIHALNLVITNVQETIVVMEQIVIMVFAIKTDLISILSEMEIMIFMGPDQIIKLIQQNLSKL